MQGWQGVAPPGNANLRKATKFYLTFPRLPPVCPLSPLLLVLSAQRRTRAVSGEARKKRRNAVIVCVVMGDSAAELRIQLAALQPERSLEETLVLAAGIAALETRRTLRLLGWGLHALARHAALHREVWRRGRRAFAARDAALLSRCLEALWSHVVRRRQSRALLVAHAHALRRNGARRALRCWRGAVAARLERAVEAERRASGLRARTLALALATWRATAACCARADAEAVKRLAAARLREGLRAAVHAWASLATLRRALEGALARRRARTLMRCVGEWALAAGRAGQERVDAAQRSAARARAALHAWQSSALRARRIRAALDAADAAALSRAFAAWVNHHRWARWAGRVCAAAQRRRAGALLHGWAEAARRGVRGSLHLRRSIRRLTRANPPRTLRAQAWLRRAVEALHRRRAAAAAHAVLGLWRAAAGTAGAERAAAAAVVAARARRLALRSLRVWAAAAGEGRAAKWRAFATWRRCAQQVAGAWGVVTQRGADAAGACDSDATDAATRDAAVAAAIFAAREAERRAAEARAACARDDAAAEARAGRGGAL